MLTKAAADSTWKFTEVYNQYSRELDYLARQVTEDDENLLMTAKVAQMKLFLKPRVHQVYNLPWTHPEYFD